MQVWEAPVLGFYPLHHAAPHQGWGPTQRREARDIEEKQNHYL